ncbi:MAG: hypothetical protein WAM27_01655 [Nitrososphaeraceae archaeon]
MVTITVISYLLIEQSNQEQSYAQNQTQGTNFTQLFSTDKEFLETPCPYTAGCPEPIKVLYEDPTLLVLGSDYIDVIWKGVARAQKEGYQIDSMTSYAVSNAGSSGRTVNLLVAMSK